MVREGPPALRCHEHSGHLRGEIWLAGSLLAIRLLFLAVFATAAAFFFAVTAEDSTMAIVGYVVGFITLGVAFVSGTQAINPPAAFDVTPTFFELADHRVDLAGVTAARVDVTGEGSKRTITLVLEGADPRRWSVHPVRHEPADVEWLAQQIRERLTWRSETR